jgi:hypothetical protein
MSRVLVSWLAITAIALSALPAELIAANSEEPGHHESSESPPEPGTCPGRELCGDPCGNDCLCPCCPTLIVIHTTDDLPEVVALDGGSRLSYIEHLNPRDVIDRIFHPPRAG